MTTHILSSTLLLLLCLSASPSTAQQAPEATGSTVSRMDAQEALDFHNKIRKNVGSPPLSWSVKLAEYAQAWANQLANSGCKIKHRPRSGEWQQKYGENIYWCNGFVATAMNASENWYS